MAELTENPSDAVEKSLTPTHSIPPSIQNLQVSGSKGRFSSEEVYEQTPVPAPNTTISSYDPKQYVFDQLYMDAAKRSLAKEKLEAYAKIKKEKEAEAEVYKSEKRLSKAESLELFGRLNKDAEDKQKRHDISQKIREAQEMKEIRQPKINKVEVQFKQDVITRLMQYGDNAKRRNEEKIRLKQEREEEEIKNTPSVHRKTLTESSLSNVNTPVKSSSNKSSPMKKYIGTGNTSVQDISPVRSRYLVSNSSNSPEKIIQKIQNLAKLTDRAVPKSAVMSNNAKLSPVKITKNT